METVITERLNRKYRFAWHLRDNERILIGGLAQTRERAEKAAYRASRLKVCHRCGKWAAGGGHRFCRSCLLIVLEETKTPWPPHSFGVGRPAEKPYPTNHQKPWSQNGHQKEEGA